MCRTARVRCVGRQRVLSLRPVSGSVLSVRLLTWWRPRVGVRRPAARALQSTYRDQRPVRRCDSASFRAESDDPSATVRQPLGCNLRCTTTRGHALGAQSTFVSAAVVTAQRCVPVRRCRRRRRPSGGAGSRSRTSQARMPPPGTPRPRAVPMGLVKRGWGWSGGLVGILARNMANRTLQRHRARQMREAS